MSKESDENKVLSFDSQNATEVKCMDEPDVDWNKYVPKFDAAFRAELNKRLLALLLGEAVKSHKKWTDSRRAPRQSKKSRRWYAIYGSTLKFSNPNNVWVLSGKQYPKSKLHTDIFELLDEEFTRADFEAAATATDKSLEVDNGWQKLMMQMWYGEFFNLKETK